MKCHCGYIQYEDFDELISGDGRAFYRRIANSQDRLPKVKIYICPKCGTLKVG